MRKPRRILAPAGIAAMPTSPAKQNPAAGPARLMSTFARVLLSTSRSWICAAREFSITGEIRDDSGGSLSPEISLSGKEGLFRTLWLNLAAANEKLFLHPSP